MGLGFICELTPKCNLRCGFCYNVWHERTFQSALRTLDIDGWKRVLDNLPLRDEAEWLCFSGGEPLLSEALLPLTKHVRGTYPNVRIGVATNGTLLTDEHLRAFVEGIDYLELSLLSLDPARYTALTGLDLLAQAKAAIISAASASIPLTVAITLVPMEPTALCQMLDFALGFGAEQIALNRFACSGKGASNPTEFQMGNEKLRELLAAAEGFATKRAFAVDVTIPMEDCLYNQDGYSGLRFHPCVCGEYKWVVGPGGGLRTCEQNLAEVGDLTLSSFAELRQHPSVAEFRVQNLRADCRECPKWDSCGGGCRFVVNEHG